MQGSRKKFAVAPRPNLFQSSETHVIVSPSTSSLPQQHPTPVSLAMSAQAITKLLDKCSHWDKDERYMATSDLEKELLKDNVLLDAALERRVCQEVLKQLDDANNDVQSVAVKVLGVLLVKVREEQILR